MLRSEIPFKGFPDGSSGKEPTRQCRRHERHKVQSLRGEDPLEEGIATHSSILAWRTPTDKGAWRATVQEVAKNQTGLSMHAGTWCQEG